MLCMWESTTEIEKEFAVVRHLTASLKAATSPQVVHDLLKVVSDGPTAAEVSPHSNRSGISQYAPSRWTILVQQRWRYFFGSSKNHCKSGLPRRSLGNKCKKGLPGLLQKQKENTQEVLHDFASAGLAPDEVNALKKSTEEAANERRSSKQHQDLLATLRKNASKKRAFVKAFAAGADHEASKKLKAHQEDKAIKDMTTVVRRSLQKAAHLNRCLQAELCIAVPMSDLSAAQKRILDNLGITICPFEIEDVPSMILVKNILWCATTNEEETLTIDGNLQPTLPFIASRLLGGYVCGPEWFDQSQKSQFIVEPVMLLKPATCNSTELCLHKSLPERNLVQKMLVKISSAGCDMRWVVRNERHELTQPYFFIQYKS